ncbi:MAG TPA: hypothetical protein PKZ12_04125 [Smithellaceae bacterium]|nr:hypothetical protein [Smithellaceae bacterium]
MKTRMLSLVLLLVFVFLPQAGAQEYGRIKALQQRAAYVTKQKNDFVARVLSSYSISHERNNQGVVVRINLEGKWHNVTAIEIIPVLREAADKRKQVTAHELFFYTAEGIMDLLSELTIR